MDWPYIHLIVSHFPIVLGVVGAGAALAAILLRRDAAWRFAIVLVLLAGLTSPAAYFSGREAEETVEEEWYVAEQQVEEHEEAGLVAFIALLAAAAVAGLAWWTPRSGFRGAFVALALASALLTGKAALEGGKIVHEAPGLESGPSLRREPTEADDERPSAEASAEDRQPRRWPRMVSLRLLPRAPGAAHAAAASAPAALSGRAGSANGGR